MTTLPQTTGNRPPQPLSTLPTPPMGGPLPMGVVNANAMSASDVWRVIRANLWLIILLAIVGGVGGYALNWWIGRNWPKYTSVGYLQIQQLPNYNPTRADAPERSQTLLQSELKTQAALLTTEQVFSRLIKDSTLVRETSWFKGLGGNPRLIKEYLQDYVAASPVTDSSLIRVSFTCESRSDCSKVIRELVDIHLTEQKKVAENQLAGRTGMLNTKKQELNNTLTTLSKSIATRRADLAGRGMDLTREQNTGKEHERDLLMEQMIKLGNEANDARVNFNRVKELINIGQQLPEIEMSVTQDYTIQGIERELSSYKIQLDITNDIKGEGSADSKRLQALVNRTQSELERKKEELRIKYRDQFIQTLEGRATQAENERQKLDERLAAIRKELEDLGRDYSNLRNDVDRENKLLTELHEVEVALSNLAVVNSLQAKPIDWAPNGLPEEPEYPSFPQLKVFLPCGVILGIALALGLAFLREWMDDTLRSPLDIGRVEHQNVLGMIADENDDPQASDAQVAIFDSPQSITAEQFRLVRTRLQHLTSFNSTRSILVSGPSPQDGKTTIAVNLASALALNGRKTLLIDANFRQPEVHRRFGVENGKGFSEILNGSANLRDSAVATRIPNLSVLTSGAKIANAAEIFESNLLSEFIKQALAEYDHVIFDSGPMLIASEAVALAAKVDGVIVVVRAHVDSRGMLQRTREELKKVGAENLGVILNAVRARGGGYYGRSIKTYYDYQGD